MISQGLKKLIEENALALASIDENGNPHNIAVACCKVEGDKIIISNTHIHKTVENIKANKNISFVVWNKEWEKACVGFEILGTAENYESGEWLDYVKKLPDNEGYEIKSAIVVDVTKVNQLKA